MSLSLSHEIKSRDYYDNLMSTTIINYSLHVGSKNNYYAVLESVQIRAEIKYNAQLFDIDLSDVEDRQYYKDKLENTVQCDVLDSVESDSKVFILEKKADVA